MFPGNNSDNWVCPHQSDHLGKTEHWRAEASPGMKVYEGHAFRQRYQMVAHMPVSNVSNYSIGLVGSDCHIWNDADMQTSTVGHHATSMYV
jgi:hypothetical protein